MFTTTWMDDKGNIHYIAGDPFRLDLINIYNEDEPIDFAGWTVQLRVFDPTGNKTLIEFSEDDCDLTVPGALAIEKNLVEMKDLQPGQYYFDWKMGEPNKEPTTWLNNKLFFVE